MQVFVSPHAKRKYRKLIKKNLQLGKKLDKALEMFIKNSSCKSLRLHKLSSKKMEVWSITVEGNLRIIFQYVDEGIYITNIGSHDEVY